MGTLWDEDILAKDQAAEDAKAAAIQFEAVKSHMRQSKDGLTLSLVIHPTDSPPAITLAHIGQRFLCVLVPIDDHEQPLVPPEVRDRAEWVRLCGIICKDIEFKQWMVDQKLAQSLDDDDVAQAVRDFCRVSSRAQLKDDEDAMRRWRLLHSAYVNGGTI